MHLEPDVLKQFAAFQTLSEVAARGLSERVWRREARRGDALFQQGQDADHLVLLASGRVKMERTAPDGAMTIVEVLGPGNLLGGANFLGRRPYPASAVALTDVVYGELAYAAFESVVRAHPDIALGLLAYLAERLRRSYSWSEKAARTEPRLAATLARLARDMTSSGGAKDHELELSHEDLAEMTGMARETVTRHLQRWQERGWVRIRPRRIAVVDPESLEHLAHGE